MKSIISYGKCYVCQKTFVKKVMTKHLQSCIKRNNTIEAASSQKNIKKVKYFHIVAEGKDYLSDYWLHIKASAAATLEELDNLLREIWLECCGHLSLFRIDNEEYFSEPDEDWEQEGMNVKLNNVLSLNKKFYHEYDFGSTTYLKLKVVAESYDELKGSNIEVIARNDQPPIICSYCDKLATKICTECLWSGEGWLCDDCAKNHKCSEEMFLPVVNSSRTGICGYTGY